MKNLILLANEFPYGNFEPYLESEIKFYNIFKHIYLCSMQLRREHMKTRRDIELDNISFCDVVFAPKIIYFIYSIYVLFDKNFYAELLRVLKYEDKRNIINNIIRLVVFLSRSHYEFKKIKKFLKKEFKDKYKDEGIIYSYRFEYQAYVALLIKKNFPDYKVVSRAHGYDLYEFRRKGKYIPMREYILKNIDKVICISDDGKNYLSAKYPLYKNKIEVMKLGTMDHGFSSLENKADKDFNMVSCSAMVEIKRLDMLVKTLANIDFDITWTHYGDGREKDKIYKMCEELLPDNIRVIFKGHVDNKALVESEYKNNFYNLFINISSTEGIPVSIMEAFSYGIPVVATDVGGNKEIVKDGYNGRLINKDFTCKELADSIKYFYLMSEDEYSSYRDNARNTWNDNFNASRQYSRFIDFLNEL